MSKFNEKKSVKTVNKSGHIAYDMKDNDKLVTMVLCSFFNERKCYGDNSNELVELAEKVASKEPRFVSNLARVARKEYHLRSVSHVLTCIIAHEVESKPYIKETVYDVVERADDITEILSCYLSMYGKPIPNGLKKALGTALTKFNEFQISKYNGGSKSIKFRDVLRITHIKPKNNREQELFNKIINDTLPIATRWETELSANGNNKETWESLIENNQLGYMAMLRNLRNILNAQPNNIDKVFVKLEDKEEVLKSKQLPFRYFSAYREVMGLSNCSSKVLDVLENAIEHSVENLPKLKGKTVIAIDVSGSMDCHISKNSSIMCCDIAILLGVLASRMCEDYIVYTFDTSLYDKTFSSHSSIIGTALKMRCWGGGTDIELPLKKMINDKIQADRLIILSDNEINNSYRGYTHTCQSLADEYRRKVNPNLWVHAVDLQGYGTQQFIGGKTNIVAGWSERLLEFMNLAEQGIDTQVEYIANYHIRDLD